MNSYKAGLSNFRVSGAHTSHWSFFLNHKLHRLHAMGVAHSMGSQGPGYLSSMNLDLPYCCHCKREPLAKPPITAV